MNCYECGVSYKKWEQTDQTCEGSEHDWESGLDDDLAIAESLEIIKEIMEG